MAPLRLLLLVEALQIGQQRVEVRPAGEDELFAQFQAAVQLLNVQQSLDLNLLDKPQFDGDFTEQLGVSVVFLDFQDLIDLLNGQQPQPQRQGPRRISHMGPFAGGGNFLFVKSQLRLQEFSKRVAGGGNHVFVSFCFQSR